MHCAVNDSQFVTQTQRQKTIFTKIDNISDTTNHKITQNNKNNNDNNDNDNDNNNNLYNQSQNNHFQHFLNEKQKPGFTHRIITQITQTKGDIKSDTVKSKWTMEFEFYITFFWGIFICVCVSVYMCCVCVCVCVCVPTAFLLIAVIPSYFAVTAIKKNAQFRNSTQGTVTFSPTHTQPKPKVLHSMGL